MKQSQAPSRLPAQCRAGQLLTGENLDAPANNLLIKIRDAPANNRKSAGTASLWQISENRKPLQSSYLLIHPQDATWLHPVLSCKWQKINDKLQISVMQLVVDLSEGSIPQVLENDREAASLCKTRSC